MAAFLTAAVFAIVTLAGDAAIQTVRCWIAGVVRRALLRYRP
ncbi:hypothetical protein [Zavarzinella formosa]|nr:hypothetical protein [Zavarzinella formosa]